MSRRSKVEINGFLARHYDLVMDLLFLGNYGRFVRNVIATMQIRQGESILDLGSGTGRNICMMVDAVGPTGRVVGVDIGQQMLEQARRRCRPHPQVAFLKARVEEPLPFRQEFDKVCLFFVVHGFEDDDKERIFANARKALKPGGTLWILDYAEFALEDLWFPVRWAFTRFECELALEFVQSDLKGMLARAGFAEFVSFHFLCGLLRLAGVRVPPEPQGERQLSCFAGDPS